MPTPRSELSTSAINGKIYAMGGTDGRRPLSTVEEYNSMTNKWIEKKAMPTARQLASACVVNGRIYILGSMRDRSEKSPVSSD